MLIQLSGYAMPKIKKSHSFLRVILLLLVLRITDLLITYHYTPDLRFEFNPLVSVFGATWMTFIVLQLVILVFISSVIYFYFFKEENTISRNDLSFRDFIYYYFNGELKPLHARFALFPRYAKRHLAFNGFIFMVLSLGVSVFAIVHNLLLVHRVIWYENLIIHHHIAVFSSLLGGALIISSTIFFIIEYSIYKNKRIEKQL